MAEHTFAGLTCPDVQDLAAGFVLGALTPAESDTVRRHLAECPELHAEMAELNSVVPALFEAVDPVAPPTGLKDRILAAAAADLEARGAQAQPAPAPSPDMPARPAASARPSAPARPAEPARWNPGALFRRPVWALVAAAALVAALALGAWNVQLRDQVAGLEAYRTGVVKVLDTAAQPEAQLAILAAPAGQGPSGLAAWGADGNVALVMRDLEPTTGTQVYEAWLIAGTSAPIPIGGFQVGTDRTGTFGTNHVPLGEGVVVALTLEPREGAKTPTMPILALGTARAAQSS